MPIANLRRVLHEGPLIGSLIAAMPGMRDDRFRRAVIYICHHDNNGTMGLIINKLVPHLDVACLLERLDCVEEERKSFLSERFQGQPIYQGGPVESGRGLLLHSDDYAEENATLAIAPGLGLTTTTTILKAIAENEGPEAFLLALGYSGWGPGQLEHEILENSWLNCVMPSDTVHDLLFEVVAERRYDAALGGLGIAVEQLSVEAGRC